MLAGNLHVGIVVLNKIGFNYFTDRVNWGQVSRRRIMVLFGRGTSSIHIMSANEFGSCACF